jgi:hypothetical protein
MKKVDTWKTEIYNFSTVCLHQEIQFVYVICNVNTVPYRVKSSSLFVKQAISYPLRGKELNFYMPSLVTFFRLLDFILYDHVSV